MAENKKRPNSSKYQIGLLILLTLANGVVAFDRLLVSFLSPYIVESLGLSDTQLALLASALSCSIAFSAFFGGRLADRWGRRKMMLIVCTVAFSIGSAAGAFAMSFAMLFAARFVLGLAEGPMVPIGQTVIAQSTAPKYRGVAMGFMQMVGAFGIAGTLGPNLAVSLADSYGWRDTLFASILPGLILAVAIALVMKPDGKTAAKTAQGAGGSILDAFTALLKIPNMRVTLTIAGLITAWLMLQNTFLMVYLIDQKGLSETSAALVVGMGGLAGMIGGISLPFLSDRIGRRPVMIFGSLAGIACPIGLLMLPGDPTLLAGCILLGWIPLGIAPLYCATIPTESVSPVMATTAVGLSFAAAELFGGVIVPPIGGMAGDAFGRDAIFMICIGLALAAAFAALFLKETAPCVVGEIEEG